MNDIIEITESNYKGYCGIDIAAFSFATRCDGGARGS